MERVSFLVEATGARLPCLLNPETLAVRRVAGVRPRRSAAGALTGAELTDDPLLHTGGGRTEIDLDLLFDVTLGGGSVATEDVRDLTRPFWNLAENAGSRAPQVRFVWGKTWNIPGVVVSVADTVVLRASIVIGAASRSFRFLVRLVERMPVLTVPAWSGHRTAPIDERDMVEFLLRAGHSPRVRAETLDVGGPDVVTYGELIDRIRELMLLGRPIISLRRLTVTPIASRVAAVIAYCCVSSTFSNGFKPFRSVIANSKPCSSATATKRIEGSNLITLLQNCR